MRPIVLKASAWLAFKLGARIGPLPVDRDAVVIVPDHSDIGFVWPVDPVIAAEMRERGQRI